MKNYNQLMTQTSLALMLSATIFAPVAFAEGEELQDMSDPLAVFTQAGVGYTDKGLNLKIGQTYDTGSDTSMGMNIIEIKGFLGEELGWNSSTNNRKNNDNSIDSMRYRNFEVDLTNGRGSQVDVNLGFQNARGDGESLGTQGAASYSFIQALPKMGPVNLYPLAGAGVAFGQGEFGMPKDDDQASAQDRWNLHGTFYVVGMYSKVELTDNIWFNYNPMYVGTVSGSNQYKDYGIAGDDSMLIHEAALSYQINPRTNIRYFANWNEETDFSDGDHRIEVNYQF